VRFTQTYGIPRPPPSPPCSLRPTTRTRPPALGRPVSTSGVEFIASNGRILGDWVGTGWL
jgi:hypothetical protein